MNDFLALLVSNEEIKINSFKELINTENISISVQEGSFSNKVFKKVNYLQSIWITKIWVKISQFSFCNKFSKILFIETIVLIKLWIFYCLIFFFLSFICWFHFKKQEFEINPNKIKTIQEKELFTRRTIDKLIEHKSVIVAESRVTHKILNSYSQYKLKETGDHEDFYMFGFVIRKNLNSKIKQNLKKMWAINILLTKYCIRNLCFFFSVSKL